MRQMMRAGLVMTGLLLASGVMYAHVTVAPPQSQGGATERYTVTVPTEGQVTTISVDLEIPAGVMVTEVVPGDGFSFDVRRESNRIVGITWKRDIPPGSRAEFVFVVTNPPSGQLAWKARQRFADGTSADWIGVEGDRRPASVTTITAAR
jgi:uncharacterized protein YcnI